VRRDQVHAQVQVEYRSSINSYYIYIYIYIYICELILGSPMSILYKKIPEVITFYLQQKKKTRRLVTTLSLHYLINDKVELLITIHIITIF
jgi:hypothetical protein